MSITTITETELHLTHMLNVCTEALKDANKEGDALRAEIKRLKSTVLYRTLNATLDDERIRGLQLLADAKEWQQMLMKERAELAALKQQKPVGCSVCSEVHSILDADESKIIRNARDGYPEGREPRELTIADRVIVLCVYAADWKRWYVEAQEQRQPLTDDEIDEIGVDFPGDYQVLRAFARAIEAKLKARNE